MFQQADNYGSAISTKNPFAIGDVRRVSQSPSAYTGPNQTRNAFAEALRRRNANDTRVSFDQADLKYRQQAEQYRAEDVASQRRNQLEQYGLGKEKDLEFRRQDIRRTQTLADLATDLDIAKRNFRVNQVRSYANLGLALGSLAIPSYSTITNAYRTSAGKAGAALMPAAAPPSLIGGEGGFGGMGVLSGLYRD